MASLMEVVPRAPRVVMEAPMLIRRSGDGAWRRATTINMSRTGVLLRTDGLVLDPQTPVEIEVTLPVYGDLAANRVFGTGRIVRVLPSGPAAPDPVMAAHFDHSVVLSHAGQHAASV